MAATQDPHPMHREADLADFVWKQIRGVLERVRDRIHEEIRSYPAPIPACDEQFNHLLTERARASHELDRLNRIAGAPASITACSKFLDELVASSDLISSKAEQKIRSYLRGGVAADEG